ncbi:MAG: hypothetical protein ACRD23_03910 [Terriglobales bacterium]
MPVRKSRLNRVEAARYLSAIQELHTGGVDFVTGELLEDSRGLDVMVARGPASSAFDLPNAGTGYAIYLRLVSRRSRLILPYHRLTAKWDSEIALVDFDEDNPICKLGWLTYPRDHVLNQRLQNSLQFHYRGQMIEGTILALGVQPLPAAYRTGARVPLQITFGDTLGHQIDVEAELYSDRMTKRKNATAPRGTGLYDRYEAPEARAIGQQRIARRPRLETGYPEWRV